MSTQEPGRVSRIVCCRNGVRRIQGRDFRIKHIGEGNGTSDSEGRPDTMAHVLWRLRLIPNSRPAWDAYYVLSEKEKHRRMPR